MTELKRNSFHILLIDDNPADTRAVERELFTESDPPYELHPVDELDKGLSVIKNSLFDAVILSLSLPGSAGIEALLRFKRQAPELPVVILAGNGDRHFALEAVQSGAQDFLYKNELGGRVLSRSIRYAIERFKSQEALRLLALSDELTGLYNRRGFMKLAEHELLLARRRKSSFCLVYADIDGMGQINARHGEAEGDRCLKLIAGVLMGCFRGTDIVGRIGGDEFGVIAIDASMPNLETLTARLKNRVLGAGLRQNLPYRLSLSLGVSYFDPSLPHSIDNLLDDADKQMHEAKLRLTRKAGEGVK